MSGGPIPGGRSLNFTDPDQFLRWLSDFAGPEAVMSYLKLFGKPKVRVPVQRQTPNEADL